MNIKTGIRHGMHIHYCVKENKWNGMYTHRTEMDFIEYLVQSQLFQAVILHHLT